MVVSIEEDRRLTGGKPDCKAFLLSAPDLGALDLRRSDERARAATAKVRGRTPVTRDTADLARTGVRLLSPFEPAG